MNDNLIEELICQNDYVSAEKDIILVVRDRYQATRDCIESILDSTEDFTIRILDNDSEEKTAAYVADLAEWHENVFLKRVQEPELTPGVLLAKYRHDLIQEGTSPFLVLMESCMTVTSGWSEALIGYLQRHPETGIVGYEGGLLSATGIDVLRWSGSDIDYVLGTCLAVGRDRFLAIDRGVFGPTAGEDIHWSLSIREAGMDVYALNVAYAERTHDRLPPMTRAAAKDVFVQNHVFLAERYSEYLRSQRVLLSHPHLEMNLNYAELTPDKVVSFLEV